MHFRKANLLKYQVNHRRDNMRHCEIALKCTLAPMAHRFLAFCDWSGETTNHQKVRHQTCVTRHASRSTWRAIHIVTRWLWLLVRNIGLRNSEEKTVKNRKTWRFIWSTNHKRDMILRHSFINFLVQSLSACHMETGKPQLLKVTTLFNLFPEFNGLHSFCIV